MLPLLHDKLGQFLIEVQSAQMQLEVFCEAEQQRKTLMLEENYCLFFTCAIRLSFRTCVTAVFM